jgi:hypothetical protein
VQHHQRLAVTRLGDMKTDALHLEVAVLDARDVGHLR